MLPANFFIKKLASTNQQIIPSGQREKVLLLLLKK